MVKLWHGHNNGILQCNEIEQTPMWYTSKTFLKTYLEYLHMCFFIEMRGQKH